MKNKQVIIAILVTILYALFTKLPEKDMFFIVAIPLAYIATGNAIFIEAITTANMKWLNVILMSIAGAMAILSAIFVPLAVIPIVFLAATFYYNLIMGVKIPIAQNKMPQQVQEMFSRLPLRVNAGADTEGEYFNTDIEKLLSDMDNMELRGITQHYVETYNALISDYNKKLIPDEVIMDTLENLQDEIVDILEMVTINKQNTDDVEVFKRLNKICIQSLGELQP